MRVSVSSVDADKCWPFDRINFNNNIFLKLIPCVRNRWLPRPTNTDNIQYEPASANLQRCMRRVWCSVVGMAILMRANMKYNYYFKMINISFRSRCSPSIRWLLPPALRPLEYRSNYCTQIFAYYWRINVISHRDGKCVAIPRIWNGPQAMRRACDDKTFVRF